MRLYLMKRMKKFDKLEFYVIAELKTKNIF